MALTLAKREFEAWFLASAESLRGVCNLPDNLERPDQPEGIRNAKGWIKKNRSDNRYSETIDQASYCAKMNFVEATTHSPSFAKFHRDLKLHLEKFQQTQTP